MNKEQAIQKVKKYTEWIATIDIMTPRQRADQCYGVIMGAQIALGLDMDEELTLYWENLRARIYGYDK